MSHPEHTVAPLTLERVLGTLARVGVWLALFAVIYLLRSFFLLIFLTFVFAYIQANAVRRMESRIKNRPLRVVLAAVMLLSVLIAIGWFLIPRVRYEAGLFVDRLPSYAQSLDAELLRLSAAYPVVGELLPGIDRAEVRPAGDTSIGSLMSSRTPTGMLLHRFLGADSRAASRESLKQSLDVVRNIGAYLGAIGSAFFLSLLFSFLIVLDLPSLIVSARSLGESKLRFIYHEVAPSIVEFGRVLGRAIEAQLVIALLNTVLTAIGMYVLGIGEKAAFISVIVFACSFIPVAGVFISSVPICLVALQAGGPWLLVWSIVLITVIHMVEAYILNPRIYGHHLHMNPVVVLIILTIAGKMFHVWGLILGVPICTYIFGHAIRRDRRAPGGSPGQ